jgi:hypothetical protein
MVDDIMVQKELAICVASAPPLFFFFFFFFLFCFGYHSYSLSSSLTSSLPFYLLPTRNVQMLRFTCSPSVLLLIYDTDATSSPLRWKAKRNSRSIEECMNICMISFFFVQNH